MVHTGIPGCGESCRETNDSKRNKATASTRTDISPSAHAPPSPPARATCQETLDGPIHDTKVTIFKNQGIDNSPGEIIASPLENDVLLGVLGTDFKMHPGNVRFRSLVDEQIVDFHDKHWADKQDVARRIVWTIQINDRGRFLTKALNNNGWVEVLDHWSIRKVQQALRNRNYLNRMTTAAEQTNLRNESSKHDAATKTPTSVPLAINMNGLTEKDILLGNDEYHRQCTGNIRFKFLIEEQISNYLRCSHLAGRNRRGAYHVDGSLSIKHARSIVKILRDNGGRFMVESPNKNGWVELPYQCTVEWTQQALKDCYSGVVDTKHSIQSLSERTEQRCHHDESFMERANGIHQTACGVIEQKQEELTRVPPLPPSLLQPAKPSMSYCTVKVISECPHSNKTHYEVRTWSEPTRPPHPAHLLQYPPSIPHEVNTWSGGPAPTRSPHMLLQDPPSITGTALSSSSSHTHETNRHYHVNQMHVGHHDDMDDWAQYHQGHAPLAMDILTPLIPQRDGAWQKNNPSFGHFPPTPNDYYGCR